MSDTLVQTNNSQAQGSSAPRRPASARRAKIQGQSAADAAQGSGATAAPDDTAKNLLKTKKASKPAYLQSLSQSEKAENFKIIDNMNKKIAYMKNPRYKVNRAPITMTTVSASIAPADCV